VEFGCSFVHDGHCLVYDSYGAGDRVVVYLHGLLLDSGLNRGIAQALAERGHRVILLDLLGHGRSDKPARATEYRIDTYADEVIGLLDHLGLERAVVGGISLGANVSLFAAAQHPERVNALVLEMPVLERAVPPAALVFVPMILAAYYGRPAMNVTSSSVARLPPTPFGPLNAVLNAASLTPRTVAAVLHGMLVGPIAPTQAQRQAITVPVLVVGHHNDFIHPFNDAIALVAQLPHGRLVRANSPLELRLRPERLTGEIAGFLADLEAPAGRRRSRTA
jgi:pimeloyl-ACP methyl ester carboxylesterase